MSLCWAVCSDFSIDHFDLDPSNRKLELQLTSFGDRFRDCKLFYIPNKLQLSALKHHVKHTRHPATSFLCRRRIQGVRNTAAIGLLICDTFKNIEDLFCLISPPLKKSTCTKLKCGKANFKVRERRNKTFQSAPGTFFQCELLGAKVCQYFTQKTRNQNFVDLRNGPSIQVVQAWLQLPTSRILRMNLKMQFVQDENQSSST